MGEPSKDFALPEERLASEESSEGQREECTTPSTGRMAQNPATAPTHQTLSDKKLRKSHGHFLDSAKRKLKRGFCGSSSPQALQRRYVQQATSG